MIETNLSAEQIVKLINSNIDKFTIFKSSSRNEFELTDTVTRTYVEIEKHALLGTSITIKYKDMKIAEHIFSYNKELKKLFKTIEKKYDYIEQEREKERQKELEELRFEFQEKLQPNNKKLK